MFFMDFDKHCINVIMDRLNANNKTIRNYLGLVTL